MADAHPIAVFLDRDGVICRNVAAGIRSWSDFEFLPGALDALSSLARHSFRVVVVTNQANVGRRLLSRAHLEDIHRRMVAEVAAAGGLIDAVYVCEHRPEDACECRKPRPRLFVHAASELGCDLTRAYVVGDHASDVNAADKVGATPILVLSGRSSADDVRSDCTVFADLASAVRWLTGGGVSPSHACQHQAKDSSNRTSKLFE